MAIPVEVLLPGILSNALSEGALLIGLLAAGCRASAGNEAKMAVCMIKSM